MLSIRIRKFLLCSNLEILFCHWFKNLGFNSIFLFSYKFKKIFSFPIKNFISIKIFAFFFNLEIFVSNFSDNFIAVQKMFLFRFFFINSQSLLFLWFKNFAFVSSFFSQKFKIQNFIFKKIFLNTTFFNPIDTKFNYKTFFIPFR